MTVRFQHFLIGFVAATYLAFHAETWAAGPIMFNHTQLVHSGAGYFNGQSSAQAGDIWSGNVDLSVSGTASGSSSLPNPGNNSSVSGAFSADHKFSALSWDLKGATTASFNAGLGNPGSIYSTVGDSTFLGGSYSFYLEEPTTLTLDASLMSQFIGTGSNLSSPSGATIALYAESIGGVLIQDYVAYWSTASGSTGGSYTDTFLNGGVFRLEARASSLVASNILDASGTLNSSYNAILTVAPVGVPEPGSALLLGVTGILGLAQRRRRRAAPLVCP